MRVFKNKWFNRWANRENISDSVLIEAAKDILEEKVEADLGGGLFKKRLARAGGGIIFLYAFAKSEKANISEREDAALSLVAEAFISATDNKIDQLLSERSVWEVKHNE